uniref:Secreted protein n=1 Tax=Triticum urartu TaxID=4572 RepID=A0A8R7V2W9_TRIUA
MQCISTYVLRVILALLSYHGNTQVLFSPMYICICRCPLIWHHHLGGVCTNDGRIKHTDFVFLDAQVPFWPFLFILLDY